MKAILNSHFVSISIQTNIDGELFEIKHLLILREQIAPFHVDFTVRETTLDFSKMKTAAFGLLQRRKQFFSMSSNNAILEFLFDGTPQVKEHIHDSRKDVDRQLKFVCELFIKDATTMLIGPVENFIERALQITQAFNNTSESTTLNYTLRNAPWASPQKIGGIVQESQRLIKDKLNKVQRSMQLYLSNKDTEFILFRPIRNNIISAYVKLAEILSNNGYSNDDMIITSCPSAEQINVLLSNASIISDNAARPQSNQTTHKVDNRSIAENEQNPPSLS